MFRIFKKGKRKKIKKNKKPEENRKTIRKNHMKKKKT
jgi:hypothetical protein